MSLEAIKPVILINEAKKNEPGDQSIYLQSLLAKIRKVETTQPELGRLINKIYSALFGPMASQVLRREEAVVRTPIADMHPKRGYWKGEVAAREQRVVIANVLRAGNGPSMHLQNLLLGDLGLEPKGVVMDVFSSERVHDEDGGIHSELNVSKADRGSVEGSTVIIPDPMGATGKSLAEVIKYYVEKRGSPNEFVLMIMMAAEDFLKKMQETQDEVKVAIRPFIASVEKGGLTPEFYLDPGAGDIGRRLNGTTF